MLRHGVAWHPEEQYSSVKDELSLELQRSVAGCFGLEDIT